MASKRRKKLPASATLFLKVYDVVSAAVEAGLRVGMNRARKYTDSPTEEEMLDALHAGVMAELDAVVRWPE